MSEMEEICNVINQRLLLVLDVALYKIHNNQPIEDIQQEKRILVHSKYVAYKRGVNEETLANFFNMLMVAAKLVQYRYFAQNLIHQHMVDSQQVKDLNGNVRPELNKLGQKLICLIQQKLEKSGPFTETEWNQFIQMISNDCLFDSEKRYLFESLKQIRLSE
ncbi:gamma subclass chorismate mutase AroQ [Zooshikella ganghwensis]|uniref:chorismate mutase n=1 Tax=Zooshikella ganghwensis TaxID=202772 RepID=A0A4P9VRE0_9GAMM|nr:gamma subclass chorismate mutase AroQ [Zooshikella ganghwensis]RDH45187.1 gamma subclass chorismate mutase AroQ [Zooshikella ganghwensis]